MNVPGVCRRADDDRRLYRANHLERRKVGVWVETVRQHGLAGHRECVLVRFINGAAVMQETLAVHRK